MRKTKTYPIAMLVFLAAISSCTQNEVSHMANWNKDGIIQLRSMRDKVSTRLANDNGHDYCVYSYIAGDKNWYMEGIDVDGSNDSILSGDIYYWPKYDTLSFFAYSAYGESSITDVVATVDPPSITLYYEPQGQGTDFTIATTVKQAREPGVDNVTVPLVFKHMLTKANIVLKLSDELVDYNYTLNPGTSGAVTTEDIDSVYWVNLTVPYNRGSIDVATASPTWTLIDNSSIEFIQNRTFYIMPQTYNEEADSCVLQFQNIIIKRNGVVAFKGDLLTYKLKDGDLLNNTMEMGKEYLLTLTLAPTSVDADSVPLFGDAMVFSSSAVDWNDVVEVPITQLDSEYTRNK